MAAAAANCLVTEQSRNRVPGVHVTPACTSASPSARSASTEPPLVTMAKAQGIEVKDRGRVPAELAVKLKAATAASRMHRTRRS